MRVLLLLASLFLVAGCAGLPERVGQRFAPPQAQERVVEHEFEAVYVAAQQALLRLGYELTRTGQAQGLVQAQSRLLPTERFGSSDQYVFHLRIRALDPTSTVVEATLFEQSEGQFRAGATSTPVRQHGRYEMFFERLDQVLAEGALPPAAGAPAGGS